MLAVIMVPQIKTHENMRAIKEAATSLLRGPIQTLHACCLRFDLPVTSTVARLATERLVRAYSGGTLTR